MSNNFKNKRKSWKSKNKEKKEIKTQNHKKEIFEIARLTKKKFGPKEGKAIILQKITLKNRGRTVIVAW